jgi:tight adherence protein C
METDPAELITFVISSPLTSFLSALGIAVLAGCTVLAALIGLSFAIRAHKAHQALVHRIEGGRRAPLGGPRRAYFGCLRWLFKILKIVGKTNMPNSDKKRLMVRRSLMKAGYRHPDASIIFFGVKVYLAALVPVVYSLLGALTRYLLPVSAFLLVLLAVGGFYVPNLWVKMKTRYRRRKIFSGFPDALDLMVICVEASLSLDAAIQRIAEQFQLTNRVVSEELKLLALGLRAGQSRQLALLSLSQRVDVEEVNNFVDIMIQTEQFGTNVAQSLRVQADAMRLKKRLLAEEKASKLPVKLLLPLLFFIFPSIMLIILGPGIIRLMKVLSYMINSAPAS